MLKNIFSFSHSRLSPCHSRESGNPEVNCFKSWILAFARMTGIICCLLFAGFAHAADNNFNPNHIISDADILNSKTMDLADIQKFLKDRGSFLTNYYSENADGIRKSAAEIIYDAARNNYDCSEVVLSDNPTLKEKRFKCSPISINPQFLLVLLQKEQSLIDDKNPTQNQLNWATGYGCPDGGGCNSRWRSFGKQVNSASLQFYDYMVNPHLYSYKAANVYTFTNPYASQEKNKKDILVSPANTATAALYNYTPHVYNGNYNFFTIWQRFFSKELIEGSLVQVEGELGVWLIKNGKRRPFLNGGALKSRFDANKIITISSSDLLQYQIGKPIKFHQYALIRSPNGEIYLLIDDTRRKIADSEVFRTIGFNPEEVIDASWVDVKAYKPGDPITNGSAYPTGALLQDTETGGVYWVIGGEKFPIWDAVFLKTKFSQYQIIKTNKTELDQYRTGDPVLFDDGEILKSSNSPAVYIISEGKKRPIARGEVFESLGYKWENVITVSPKVLYLYEKGELIK